MNGRIAQAVQLYSMGVNGADGMGMTMRRSYLQRSIRLYVEDIQKQGMRAPNPSVLWNLAMAHYRLAEMIEPSDSDLMIHHFGETLRNLGQAWVFQDPKVRKGEWGDKVEERLGEVVDSALRAFEAVPWKGCPRYQILDKLLQGLGAETAQELKEFKFKVYLQKGNFFYWKGVRALEKVDIQQALQLVNYAKDDVNTLLMYLVESVLESYEDAVDLLSDINSLDDSLTFLDLSCQAVGYRIQGDDLYARLLRNKEEKSDLMWDVLDLYKASALPCRERDVENEAIALSRQGRVYDQVFKIRSKAREYYRASFDLAQCLRRPQSELLQMEWYKECRAVLHRIQQEIIDEENEQMKKDKAPYLAKMTQVLQDLDAVHKMSDPYKLLKFVYSKHPPKVEFTYDEKSVDSQNIKKTLQIAITHYHPDKQVNYPMEWRILSEEITKCLTVRYENMKGVC